MKKLKRLIELANEAMKDSKKEDADFSKTEDGTVADLGIVPTGHLVNKKEYKE